MINWFNIPDEGLSNGGLFEVKELEVTENGTYETKGEMYNKVTVNVEGGGGSSDFSTATVTMVGAVHGILPYCRDMLDVEEQTWWEGGTHTIALYKGKAYVYLTNVDSVSGDIQQNDENIFIITGNCTINAKE